MRHVRIARIVVSAVVSLAVCGIGTPCSASEKYEEKIIRTVEFEDAELLIFEGSRDDVEVVGKKGLNTVKIVAFKRVTADSDEEANRIASMMLLEVEQVGDEIRISTEYPKRTKSGTNIISYLLGHRKHMSMEIHIEIPARFSADIHTASGDVSAEDISGLVEIYTASGDVTVSNLGGSLHVSVASGDIISKNVAGDVDIKSASGDIEGRDFEGDTRASTASGDIELIELGGDVEVKTASGDVFVEDVRNVQYRGTSGTARFKKVTGKVTASATSGDISLWLIPELGNDFRVSTSSGDISLYFGRLLEEGYVLNARTTTGEFDINLPIKISKIGRHSVSGVVRKGESILSLETVSGDITVEESKE